MSFWNYASWQTGMKFSSNSGGVQPTLEEIKLSKEGRVDALIRSTAIEVGGLFVSEDRVQSLIAKAKGLNVEYMYPKTLDPSKLPPLKVEHFFTEDTMSVHLKNGVPPMAKKGPVGNSTLCKDP